MPTRFADFRKNTTANLSKKAEQFIPNTIRENLIRPVARMYQSATIAYEPYVKPTETALRYGSMSFAAYTYGQAKYNKYQENRLPSEIDLKDEISLLGSYAAFALGFPKISNILKGASTAFGVKTTTTSLVSVAGIAASKEKALGKEASDVMSSAVGKAVEKYSRLGIKVGAKLKEIKSGENPVASVPQKILKAKSNQDDTLGQKIDQLGKMKKKLKQMKLEGEVHEPNASPKKNKP